jgi:Matrixin
MSRRIALIVAAAALIGVPGLQPSRAAVVAPAVPIVTPDRLAQYVKDASTHIMGSDVVVLGLPGTPTIERRDGMLYTLTPVTVIDVVKGAAPKAITVRQEGGHVSATEWEDMQSFMLVPNRLAVIPLHDVTDLVGTAPAIDGTYRINQKVLGQVLGLGAPQPPADVTAGTVDDEPACIPCFVGVALVATDVADLIADAYVTLDDTLHTVVSTATLPTVGACGSYTAAQESDADVVLAEACGAAGGSAAAGYTTYDYWHARYMPAPYWVNANTADVTGEETAVASGNETWDGVGTWFKSTYQGRRSGNDPSTIFWTPSDIDALARARVHSGHGQAGFVMYFGDQYRWSIGRKVGAWDIATVARHEWGHVLGLHHSAYERNVMFPTIPSNTIKGLGPDDIAGIRYLYPSNHYKATLTSQSDSVIAVLPGTGSYDVTVRFQNVGRTPWNYLATVSDITYPVGRCSIFDGDVGSDPMLPAGLDNYAPWNSCTKPRARVANVVGHTTIERDESATVTFRFNAPLNAFGTYTESFMLDVSGPLSITGTRQNFTVHVPADLPAA